MKFSEMISNQSTAGWCSRMYGKWTVRRPRPRPRFGCPRRRGVMTGSISRRKERKSSWRDSVAEVFQHVAALFGTVLARFGERGHVLVIRVLSAARDASV